MKKLILLTLILMASCGSGSEGTLNYPPSMPPEETPDEVPSDEVPTPPEWLLAGIDENGNKNYVSTRALYDAEEIEVFFTDAKVITEKLSFEDVLTDCINKGITGYDYSMDKIGLLNGLFKEQGYIRDFLLNPEVERTWSRNGVALPQETINTRLHYEFSQPLSKAVSSSCTDSDGNTATCKKFLCGVDKGE